MGGWSSYRLCSLMEVVLESVTLGGRQVEVPLSQHPQAFCVLGTK